MHGATRARRAWRARVPARGERRAGGGPRPRACRILAAHESLRATFKAETAELSARSTAAAEELKQRIAAQIEALEGLSHTVRERSDATDQAILQGGERVAAAASTAQEAFRATFGADG
mgnify:CR=1 FL=1